MLSGSAHNWRWPADNGYMYLNFRERRSSLIRQFKVYGWNHRSAWESGEREGYYKVKSEKVQKWISREQSIMLPLVWFLESSNHHHDLSVCSSLSLSPLPFPWFLTVGSFLFLKIGVAHQGDSPNGESITWLPYNFSIKLSIIILCVWMPLPERKRHHNFVMKQWSRWRPDSTKSN